MRIIENCVLFKDIKRDEIESLIKCLNTTRKVYAKGESVFLAGEKTEYFGILLNGQLQIVNDDFYGNRSILANIGSGQLFAESFAFAKIKSLPVSVIATTESEVMFIDCNRLVTPCGRACIYHGKLIQNMLQIVSRKNLELMRKIEITSKRFTRDKIMAYLSFEAKKANSAVFKIPFNRQELADYLSVERSAMSAELSRLRKEGKIKFERNTFELLYGQE